MRSTPLAGSAASFCNRAATLAFNAASSGRASMMADEPPVT
jgi:hypothetical protein